MSRTQNKYIIFFLSIPLDCSQFSELEFHKVNDSRKCASIVGILPSINTRIDAFNLSFKYKQGKTRKNMCVQTQDPWRF